MSLPDLLVDSTVVMAERVYAVSELIRQINLDLYRYNDIAVEGEVTNFTRSSAGHLYFSIKDARDHSRRPCEHKREEQSDDNKCPVRGSEHKSRSGQWSVVSGQWSVVS